MDTTPEHWSVNQHRSFCGTHRCASCRSAADPIVCDAYICSWASLMANVATGPGCYEVKACDCSTSAGKVENVFKPS